jgi:excisionase family DNA binding protein
VVLRKGLVSIVDAADYLDCSRSMVYRLLATGELRSVKIGRHRKIVLESLLDFVQRNQLPPVQPDEPPKAR